MKRTWIAALAAALLSACAPHAGAVSFLPVPAGSTAESGSLAGLNPADAGLAPAGDVAMPPSRFRVGMFAAFWKVPEVSLSSSTGYEGDAVRFASTTTPVVELDYRIGPRLRLGGWFNPLDTQLWFKGPTADLLMSGSQPTLGDTSLTQTSLNMWNANVSYQLRHNTAVALGLTRYQGTLDMRLPNPRAAGDLNLKAELGATELSIWGFRTLRIWEYTHKLAYLTGGLGACHRIEHGSGSPGSKTTLEGSLGIAYFPWQKLSLNAAVWATDLTNSDALTARVSTGVTGHF